MLNQSKVEAFGQKMANALNGAAIALMASIGHQTGLFDTMAALPPSTSYQIATAAKLQERYVREWLASLVAGQVIDYDPVQGTYTLPPEHALSLTRAAGPNNIASGAQIVALAACRREHPSPWHARSVGRYSSTCVRFCINTPAVWSVSNGFWQRAISTERPATVCLLDSG